MDEAILDGVGVLELIHQDVAVALPVVLPKRLIAGEQLIHAQQELGEIDQALAAAMSLVGVVELDQGAEDWAFAFADVARPPPFVLVAIDEGGGLPRREAIGIELRLEGEAADQAQLVLGVEDLEVLRQSGLRRVLAEKAMGDAMEGTDREPIHPAAEQSGYPCPHLAGGLVGEGHREQRPGRSAPFGEEERDAAGEHPGLARAGTGEHQGVTGRGGHRGALGLIEVGEEPLVHQPILRSRSLHPKRMPRPVLAWEREAARSQPGMASPSRRWDPPG